MSGKERLCRARYRAKVRRAWMRLIRAHHRNGFRRRIAEKCLTGDFVSVYDVEHCGLFADGACYGVPR